MAQETDIPSGEECHAERCDNEAVKWVTWRGIDVATCGQHTAGECDA